MPTPYVTYEANSTHPYVATGANSSGTADYLARDREWYDGHATLLQQWQEAKDCYDLGAQCTDQKLIDLGAYFSAYTTVRSGLGEFIEDPDLITHPWVMLWWTKQSPYGNDWSAYNFENDLLRSDHEVADHGSELDAGSLINTFDIIRTYSDNKIFKQLKLNKGGVDLGCTLETGHRSYLCTDENGATWCYWKAGSDSPFLDPYGIVSRVTNGTLFRKDPYDKDVIANTTDWEYPW